MRDWGTRRSTHLLTRPASLVEELAAYILVEVPIEITFAACGLRSETVLVMSMAKRVPPILTITRLCFVAIGAGSAGGSGNCIGLFGIVVSLTMPLLAGIVNLRCRPE